MKLATIQTENGIQVASVIDQDNKLTFFDLSAFDENLPRSLKGILAVEGGLERAKAAAEQAQQADRQITGTLLAPIPSPGKVLCIGLNYRDHAEETGMPFPDEPVCFSKFSSSVTGSGQPIRIPSVAREVDYEAELVAVIGKTCRNVTQANASDYVAGYMNGHDVSARDWQIGRPGGQWLLGKTADTFAPTGPYLVTADEIKNANSLSIKLTLNGEVLQNSNTDKFIFTIEEVIAFVSQILTLEPGDIIFTGTPPGVGMARKPPVYLQPGDQACIEIQGLGMLHNTVEAWD
ncbi:fumarylacetoacetate hydrolase family protein [Gimesia maris]|uniref:FAA hydrolase family protein n=1 Tax=Gimesia maris TaxID=122 RepID=A0A3D3RGN4_9PLAN|nr:fumarylacetoacetate hydrolase family protein [Gimesia maris]MAC53868.1 FAA hydrolase family protein [Gimesia sp.]EDL56747.1 2-keto-4-pentenoate hydratase/2-oxohepta-3-ene-1,7-dioic acid hydratase [Gimesia maris DSM 8797]QDT77108.1 Ureidoglycolate lyase [Gimesia maris]QEG14683.1 Ureidoglycolate lyase [Gimesia maris]QGQ31919.1 fumarylacetoacetate hydrolase family protein [Gimesia maris]|tara:strand:+ start:229638 stop:230510 length:873 start_codon:yes stop_codon:yes gene_type:complete